MRPSRQLAVSALLTVATSVGASVLFATSVTAATAPAAFGYGAPTFINSAAPATQADGTFFQSANAGEPSLGVNWASGAAMYLAGTDTYRLNFDNSKSPAGVTWTDVSSPYSVFNLDPILATDHATGTTFAGGDNGACAVMSKTTTDGGYFDSSQWTPSTPCPFTADHPTIGTGPFAGTPPINATAPFVTYFCQQTNLDHCSHSVDGGTTWSPSVLTTACAGLHVHLEASTGGAAYLPNALCGDARAGPAWADRRRRHHRRWPAQPARLHRRVGDQGRPGRRGLRRRLSRLMQLQRQADRFERGMGDGRLPGHRGGPVQHLRRRP